MAERRIPDTRTRNIAEGWIVLSALAMPVLLAHAWPEDFIRPEPAALWTGWIAFLLRTVRFHALLVTIALAAAALHMRARRLFRASLLAATLLALAAWRTVPPPPSPDADGPRLTVFSANLLMVNRTVEPLAAEILAADADLILLQEYSAHWHRALHPRLIGTHPHAVWTTREDSFGIASYSRRPFEGSVETELPLGLTGEIPQHRFVVRAGDRPVTVYNIHLLPPRTYVYFAAHRRQFRELMALLAAERLPALVSGDFNFTEASPQAAALARSGWHDAWDIAGSGYGATWPVISWLRYLPGLRIDHVYHNDGLVALDCRTGVGRGSDHRPLRVELALARRPVARSSP